MQLTHYIMYKIDEIFDKKNSFSDIWRENIHGGTWI